MGFNASAGGSKEFEMPSPGVYVARCFKMIDLGHQKTQWQGSEKISHKILISWELLSGDRMRDGKPFAVSSLFTLSLAEAAHLKKTLESWRGKAFTLEEQMNFDVSKVLGAYCLINIVHAESGGKTYANVGAVMPLQKGAEKPEGINPLVKFDVDEPDMKVFEAFGEKLQETIRACQEWQKKPEKGELESDLPWEDHAEEDSIPF